MLSEAPVCHNPLKGHLDFRTSFQSVSCRWQQKSDFWSCPEVVSQLLGRNECFPLNAKWVVNNPGSGLSRDSSSHPHLNPTCLPISFISRGITLLDSPKCLTTAFCDLPASILFSFMYPFGGIFLCWLWRLLAHTCNQDVSPWTRCFMCAMCKVWTDFLSTFSNCVSCNRTGHFILIAEMMGSFRYYSTHI